MKNKVLGYLLFFITASFCVTSGIIIYSLIIDYTLITKVLLIFITIIIITLILVVCDIIRRKIMIDGPLNEILEATKSMAKGNFNITLYTKHSYEEFDEFDFIKNDLNKMANELSKSEMLKNDFISNVSHEIKTPLSIIKNYIKLLQNKNLDEDNRRKYLNNLLIASDKLNNLVVNILNLNKLENQRLRLQLNKFNLSELLISQILQFELLINEKNITLVCDIEDNLFINSEESYLEIVVNNLISNAIKFTNNNGKISIVLKKYEGSFYLEVKDDGIGMDKETGLHIFDKFYQGDSSRSKEGNGLGLSLVKKVIDLLGGRISVSSEVGKGTTFVVVIKE